MSERSLQELREEIDRIDDSIHDLIRKRWEIVRHVAAAKGEAVRLPIRPSREAAMLRRLAARHSGPFPIAALARMWHEMIAAFTMLQAKYSIACFANEREHTCWDLARDQFGSQVPMTAYPTVRDTLLQVFEDNHQVAVLPLPGERSDAEPWWTHLAGEHAPKIIMRIPFAGVGSVRGEMREAVAVARLKLEPTGADRTLILIETEEPLSRTALNAILQRARLHPLYTVSAHHESWFHLVEIGDFVEADDPRLELIDVRDTVSRVEIVGAYAECLGPDMPGNGLYVRSDAPSKGGEEA